MEKLEVLTKAIADNVITSGKTINVAYKGYHILDSFHKKEMYDLEIELHNPEILNFDNKVNIIDCKQFSGYLVHFIDADVVKYVSVFRM